MDANIQEGVEELIRGPILNGEAPGKAVGDLLHTLGDEVEALFRDHVPVSLPYDEMGDGPVLQLDPSTINRGNLRVGVVMHEAFQRAEWFTDEQYESAVERIMRGAVLLYSVKAGTLAQCLDTAMIWECG